MPRYLKRIDMSGRHNLRTIDLSVSLQRCSKGKWSECWSIINHFAGSSVSWSHWEKNWMPSFLFPSLFFFLFSLSNFSLFQQSKQKRIFRSETMTNERQKKVSKSFNFSKKNFTFLKYFFLQWQDNCWFSLSLCWVFLLTKNVTNRWRLCVKYFSDNLFKF